MEDDSILKMPPADQGFVGTLNKMGFMTTGLDPVSSSFIEFAPSAPGPALDIGAAYGVASLPALRLGMKVIANDIDERHLEILRNNAPNSLRANLTLAPGAFPEGLNFAAGSIGCALVCRVLHFFPGSKITLAAQTLYSWINSGGRAFIVAETPYVRTLKDLIPTYEERVRSGVTWPGYFDTIHEINPALAQALPPSMHLLDPTILEREFSKAGFKIELVRLIARSDFPSWLQWDGRESVGLIASKP